MDGGMDGWIEEWMGGWMEEGIEGGVDRWMEGWREEKERWGHRGTDERLNHWDNIRDVWSVVQCIFV